MFLFFIYCVVLPACLFLAYSLNEFRSARTGLFVILRISLGVCKNVWLDFPSSKKNPIERTDTEQRFACKWYSFGLSNEISSYAYCFQICEQILKPSRPALVTNTSEVANTREPKRIGHFLIYRRSQQWKIKCKIKKNTRTYNNCLIWAYRVSRKLYFAEC